MKTSLRMTPPPPQLQIRFAAYRYVRVAERVAERLKTEDLRKLGNPEILEFLKLHRIIT